MSPEKLFTIALISGRKIPRDHLESELAQKGVGVVCSKSDTKTGFLEIIKSHPDVILISTTEPGTFSIDLNPEGYADKVRRELPQTLLALLTQYTQSNPFIQTAEQAGYNVFFETIEISHLIRLLKYSLHDREQRIWFPNFSGFLDTHRPERE
jgi:DNA-binding NarL/FixJ family response regulator